MLPFINLAGDCNDPTVEHSMKATFATFSGIDPYSKDIIYQCGNSSTVL